MFVLAPGFRSPAIPLNDAMKTARDDRIANHNHAKAKRQAAGAPQSDDVDYDALATALESAAKAAKAGDDDTVVNLMQDAGGFLASSVRAPEPFEPKPEWDDLRVTCILLSREAWSDGRFEAMDGLRMGDSDALKRLLGSCIEVEGLKVEGGELEGPELWSHADLLGALLQVADFFQTVDFASKKRFGSQTP